MQITGTITQVGPASAPTGQHKVRYQDVTITDDQNGKQWYGRIGSKQGYQGGEVVTVTVEVKQGQDGTYNYFKKFNPQYASQNAPQAPQQAAQEPKPDWDAIAQGKVRHGLVCAYLAAGKEFGKDFKLGDIDYWAEFIMTGKAPLPAGQQPESLDYGRDDGGRSDNVPVEGEDW